MSYAATDKQISYLASLLKTSERDVHRAVAVRWNCSPSSANRRMTKAEVSKLIDEIVKENK